MPPSATATATMPTSQSGGAHRAPLMRRESSQQSNTSSRSPGPGSIGGGDQPLRHAVKPKRHIVLPRNHNSARNLQKLQRQAQQITVVEDGRRRQRSHEGDTEIRLPGSLDESKPPPIRRNLTAYQLPRNTSHTKLKKNLSHGQLTRLGSGKNLAALNHKAGPPSPGLKPKKKRPKSADFGTVEKDLHEQEVELARQRQDGTKKVGFAVGSSGDSDGEEDPQMEGSGLQEDEWTDQSASASPFSTRQNTANNSRRTSMILDKPPDKAIAAVTERMHPGADGAPSNTESPLGRAETHPETEQEESEGGEEGEELPSPRSMPNLRSKEDQEPQPEAVPAQKAVQRSPLHAARDAKPSPATQRLLSRNGQHTAPALVSNVSALDYSHSARGSPAASMRSSKSNLGSDSIVDQEGDEEQELVSRFIPSASHPTSGSGGNTTVNTPKLDSFQTPINDSILPSQSASHPRAHFHLGARSPGSTISGSSGTTTPARERSRIEIRLLNEKAIADREDASSGVYHHLTIPPHVYDRRNESLRSNVNLALLGGDGRGGIEADSGVILGAELFQGRFKAVNTELKVVQRWRDPIAESLGRLEKCRGQKFLALRRKKLQNNPASVPMMSRSAVQLNVARGGGSSRLSTSTSPPAGSRSSTQLQRGESRRSRVTFSSEVPEESEVEAVDVSRGADAVAREMWGAVLME